MIIAIDFETSMKGVASLEAWHPDFRIDSCAFSWIKDGEIKSLCLFGEEAILEHLKKLKRHKLVAHNLQYELACWKSRFPDLSPNNLIYDTARLSQQLLGSDKSDNRFINIEDRLAELEGREKNVTGVSLVSSANRLLPKKWHNHKEPYHKFLREHRDIPKGQEGNNLHLLPKDLLEQYNTADTEVTLALFKKCITELGDFNWRFDHKLHVFACHCITDSYLRGVKVDQDVLSKNVQVTVNLLDKIKIKFMDFYSKQISHLLKYRQVKFINELKTSRGRDARRKELRESLKSGNEEYLTKHKLNFNTNSTKQLAELFVNTLGFNPVFWTKPQKNRKATTPFEPSPSFRSKHLHTYGDGGLILENSKSIQLVQKQLLNLGKYSEVDSRWHLNVSAIGTKTFRYSGMSDRKDVKLNYQGLARRNPLLMRCLIPDEGYTFISVDLTAGEPTVTAHFSQDKNFMAMNFGMVGKKPYLTPTGMLMIDDVYLGGGSVHPTGKKVILELVNTQFKGATFYQQWLDDREVILSQIKPERAGWKTGILALQYGQGANGMVETAYNEGHVLTLSDAKEFYHQFWYTLFPDVRLFGETLKKKRATHGFLVNPFGCRLYPESDHKCLNYWNQSIVSGIIKYMESLFYQKATYAKYMPPIHDEMVFQVPTHKVELARKHIDKSMTELNDMLDWTVKIRNGFVTGGDLYDAK